MRREQQSRQRSRSRGRGRENDLPMERKSRVLFVRNISFQMAEDDLRSLFEKYGEIKKLFNQVAQRGIAFVTYYDIRCAEKAHNELNLYEIEGRPIKIHYSLPKDNEINQKESLENHANLYVVFKDIKEAISKEETKEMFKEFGDVSEVRESGDKRFVKFVEYFDSRDAIKAIEKTNNMKYKEGYLEVKHASFSKRDVERIEQTRLQLKRLQQEQDNKNRQQKNPSVIPPYYYPPDRPPYPSDQPHCPPVDQYYAPYPPAYPQVQRPDYDRVDSNYRQPITQYPPYPPQYPPSYPRDQQGRSRDRSRSRSRDRNQKYSAYPEYSPYAAAPIKSQYGDNQPQQQPPVYKPYDPTPQPNEQYTWNPQPPY
ncbi:Polyadenylate-binding protein [Entamoeba marina]